MKKLPGKKSFASRTGWPWLPIFLVCQLFVSKAAAQSPGALPGLEDRQRILFLGDSITYAGGFVVSLDAWLESRGLPQKPLVLNLGLPSETVSGLSEVGHAAGRFQRPHLAERLDRVLQQVQPDLVIACYGMNCGIYQPFDEQRFAKYQQGIQQLVDKASEAKVPLVLLTPPIFDDVRSPRTFSYDREVLRRYADWLVQQRDVAGWPVIDLHAAMTNRLHEQRKRDPKFTVQPDGVHPNDQGHLWIAEILIQSFAGEAGPGPRERWQIIRSPVTRRMQVLRDAWLTQTGHQRPGLPVGLPLIEAEQLAAQQTQVVRETLRAIANPRSAKDPRR